MTVEQLVKKLKKYPPESDVLFENRVNPCGNINDIYRVKSEPVGFFGKAIPCVILRSHKK